MNRLEIDWCHLDKDGKTCDRCSDTGETVRAAYADLIRQLEPKFYVCALHRTPERGCGQPTCMAFAVQVMEGGRGAEHCPELNEEKRTKRADYLAGFVFE